MGIPLAMPVLRTEVVKASSVMREGGLSGRVMEAGWGQNTRIHMCAKGTLH